MDWVESLSGCCFYHTPNNRYVVDTFLHLLQ